jgi:hypothetical protein
MVGGIRGACWSLHETQKNECSSLCFYSGLHKSLSSNRHKNRRRVASLNGPSEITNNQAMRNKTHCSMLSME